MREEKPPMEIWTAAIIVTLALAFGVEVIRKRVRDIINIDDDASKS